MPQDILSSYPSQEDRIEWRLFSLFNSILLINHIESMNREMKAIPLNYSGLD